MVAVIQVPSGVPHLVYQVSWEKLPDDYRLPNEPVDNTDHSLLAAALRESLELAGLLDTPERLVASNVGICATVSGRTVSKRRTGFTSRVYFPWTRHGRAGVTHHISKARYPPW